MNQPLQLDQLFPPSAFETTDHRSDHLNCGRVDHAPIGAEVADAPLRGDRAMIGLLWGLDEKGRPIVRLADGQLAPARSVVPLNSGIVGCEVVLLFEEGNLARPLIMGVLQTPRPEPVRTEIDGDKLVFTAEREIVLRCGEASITLTRAGKVLIRGTYVLSRSSGVNRVKGGSVQIN